MLTPENSISLGDIKMASVDEVYDAVPDLQPYNGQKVALTAIGAGAYLIMNGELRPIPSAATFANLFTSLSSIQRNPAVDKLLEKVAVIGQPLSVNAALVKGILRSNDAFLVTNGQKMWIPSGAIFKQFDFNPKKIQAVNDAVLDAVPNGAWVG